MLKDKLRLLVEQEVEDFVQTQAEKILKFEDDPMGYILQKYPSLDATLSDLLTDSYKDYITGVFVMAPIPTTFKILLHNGQHFFLIYAKDSYIAKISGKKYYLSDLGAEEYAIKSIADLLLMGMPPGAEGPDAETDNETVTDEDTTEETPPADAADDTGDEETLAEEKENDEFAGSDPKSGSTIQGTGFNWTPKEKKFKIIREHLLTEEEEEKKSLKQQIIDLLKDGSFDDEQLQGIKNSIAGFGFKKDYQEYVDKKGINNRAKDDIFNKSLQLGIINKVMDYIDSDKPNFTNLPPSGNIKDIEKFKELPDEFLMWLYAYTIGATEKVVGVGKMEEFLTFMLDDTNNAGSGDVGLEGGGEVEVKGLDAKIWGQKDGIQSTSKFSTGQKALQDHFGDLVKEVYLGETGSATAIAPILIKNVALAIKEGASKEQALEAVKKVLKEFYNTSQSQKFVDDYIKVDSLKDSGTLNKQIFKTQLNAYADVEGWTYLWIGDPKSGNYRIFKVEELDKAVDSGQLKISSSMGLNNVYRMKVSGF